MIAVTAVSAVSALATDVSTTVQSGGGELIAFWILAPLALAGALGMVFARGAVHSALWLVLTMLCLGCLYMAQGAEFLGFAQIIVYTGAIMMLFLFVLMLTGRDAADSVIEVLRGQRIKAACVGIGLVALLVTGLVRAVRDTHSIGLGPVMAERGPIGSLAAALFTDYLFPFELTSALLITAAVGAMVLAHVERAPGEKKTQRQRVHQRMRSDRMSSLPGPGVFATSSSNATPALLPDGSIAPGSVSELVERSESVRVATRNSQGRSLAAIETADHPQRTDSTDSTDNTVNAGLAHIVGEHRASDAGVRIGGSGIGSSAATGIRTTEREDHE